MSISAPKRGNGNSSGIHQKEYAQSAPRSPKGGQSSSSIQQGQSSSSIQQGQSSSSIKARNINKGFLLLACLGIGGCCLCYGACKFLQGREVNISETLQSVVNFIANITEPVKSVFQAVKEPINNLTANATQIFKVANNTLKTVVDNNTKAENIAQNVEKASELSEETTEKCGFIAKKIIECGCDIRKSCAAIIRCMDKCKESCKQSKK